ncbi:MAG: electron transfer flavoprotein subunit beta/FixA family protein [Coriobacteriales bacterium]|jgi:electron transfer flavoprotein alpha/beta subunit
MKIITTAKRVPDTTDVKTDPKTGVLIRTGIPTIVNPDDLNALEEALEIKEQLGDDTTVTTVTMGRDVTIIKVHELLGMGADHSVLLSDRCFGGADTLVCSRTLAAGIKKIGDFDLVITGHQAIDGDTAQVGPEIARRLGIPSVTNVCDIQLKDDKSIIVTRELDDGTETLEVELPCLVTVNKKLNTPRYMTIYEIVDSYEHEDEQISIWNHEDIGLEESQCGLKASPTQVKKTYSPAPKGAGEMLSGTVQEMAATLAQKLAADRLLK